jgi:hypothetical protein
MVASALVTALGSCRENRSPVATIVVYVQLCAGFESLVGWRYFHSDKYNYILHSITFNK